MIILVLNEVKQILFGEGHNEATMAAVQQKLHFGHNWQIRYNYQSANITR